jgi:hypothetical protein
MTAEAELVHGNQSTADTGNPCAELKQTPKETMTENRVKIAKTTRIE